jgi:hypothetical protein
MRKVLLFLLIFGAGFAVVWLLRPKPTLRPNTRDESAKPAVSEGAFTDVKVQSSDSTKQNKSSVVGVTLAGPLAFTQRKAEGAEMRTELDLVSSDVNALGENVYDMHELVIQLFDTKTGKKRADLVSPLSRLKLVLAAGSPRLSDTEPVRLTNVDLTLYEGGPVTPIKLKIPVLDWNVQSGKFRSDDRVHITGTGLVGDGSGLAGAIGESSFDLLRDATITLRIEGETKGSRKGEERQVSLSSGLNGPIRARKLDKDGQELVDITASDDAVFSVSGAEPVTIKAKTIHMVGRKLPAAGSEYEILSADADGSVTATSRGDTFQARHADFAFGAGSKLARMTLDQDVVLKEGPDLFYSDHAEFEFDATGDLVKATLTGSPRADVEVGRLLPGTQRPELHTARADLTGAGPLVVRRMPEVEVDMSGPAKLDVRDLQLVLTAEKRLIGHSNSERGTGDLKALGAVELTYAESHMKSDALDLSYETAPNGSAIVKATSTGATTINGTSEEGRPFELIALNGLEARSEDGKVFVPIAHGVTISTPEPKGLTAQAKTVRDFDLKKRTFVAEGDVTFDTAQGSGRAQRAEARSRDEMLLFGTEKALAHYAFRRSVLGDSKRDLSAEADAREIHTFADHVEATGDVQAFVETKASRLDLSGETLTLTIAPEDALDPAAPRAFHAEVTARENPSPDERTHAKLTRGNESADVKSDHFVVDGTVREAQVAGAKSSVTTTDVRADGEVELVYRGRGDLDGQGDLLTLDGEGRGRLSAGAGRRVHAKGRLVGTILPYTIDADWIEFDKTHVEASQVRVLLEAAVKEPGAGAPPAPPVLQGPGESTAILHELRAQKIRADDHEIQLSGAAHIEGITLQDEPWTLDAGSIRLGGDFADQRALTTDKIQLLVAEGGFRAKLGLDMEAEGERLDGKPGKLRIEGRPAHLSMLAAEWRSAWIEYDMANMLLSTDTGSLRSKIGAEGPSWTLEYESMQPFDQGDTTILVLRNPRFRFGSQQLFADWTLFWVDRNEWKKSGNKLVSTTMTGPELHVNAPEAGGAQAKKPKTKEPKIGGITGQAPAYMAGMEKNPLFRALSEVYLEGNIEHFQEGNRDARASAMYFDIRESRGWIQQADLVVEVGLRGLPQQLRAKADWMRISPGPLLQAERAEITSCDFDEPHYVVETQDLRMQPDLNTSDERVKYRVSARRNRLRFENGLQVPLPPLVYETNEEGKPLIDRFVLGNSAKYGAAVRATFNSELGAVGKATGKAFANVLHFPETDIRGNWRYDIGILGSRGILLGGGLDLRAADKFRLELDLDAIPDSGTDKGLVKVDKDDRSLLRSWFHARARYTIREGEWVDLAISKQSDAGVQSEFFERDYLRYEQKDTYLHWRKATDEWYFNASAKVRIEDRRDTDELPSLGVYRGRSKVGEMFDNPLYYTGRADAAYLRRREGDPRYYKPFEDGLGDRDVTRVDTDHRIELPVNLGFLAMRGTPYLEARATAWDQGVDPNQAPTRAAIIAGFEAATTLWKRYSNSSVNTITPTIGFHQDLVSESNGGDPVHFDAIDDPYEGRFIDAGVRTRWWLPDSNKHLDLDVRTSYATEVASGAESGLQPIAVLGEFLTYYKTIPVGFSQDGRYDTRTGNTIYSRSALGFEPWQTLGLEFGYQRGLSTNELERLFESASIAARWRWTTKWEIELEQSYSIADGQGLGNNFILRRLGHDFITEIGVGYRAGEGSTFAIGFLPRISWKRSGLGLLDQSLGLYH